ncbi:kinase [Alphaproteobacteria bacterium]|nr:kinase [Alphaproteobacteria bacterium]
MVLKINDKEKIFIIKKELKKLINIDFTDTYIKYNYIPIIEKIKNLKKIMISGPQGSGKSTLSELIKSIFPNIYNKEVTILRLDDFYLRKSERLKLSKNVHSLLKVRGVPGTHDIKLLKKIIKKLELKKFPIYLPSFDKLKDDRRKNFRKINESDLIIFEGWCLGANFINDSFLKKNINSLEAENDPQFIWRNYYNNILKKDYQKIFLKFKYTIYIQAPSFECIYKWRLEQEFKLKKKKLTVSSKTNIKKFIQYFEKLTIWMSTEMSKDSNILINLDTNQLINKILYK